MKRTTIIIILTSLIYLGSCQKSLVETHPEFVGVWEGVDDNGLFVGTSGIECKLYIFESGKARYERRAIIETSNYGKLKIKEDHLYIGNKSFSIQEYPFFYTESLQEGNYQMILDGVTYVRTD